jgi:2-methylisocitrate lyase-like PEP mutase family enzyme
MDSPGRHFRALHEKPGAFVIPNPWDPGSARILTTMGFQALATTSSGMAFGLGLPDGAVTPDLVLDHCRALLAVTDLPISADLERGFGDDPESVARTIKAAAECGLAGCSIEDHAGNVSEPIYETSLAIERIQAACEVRDALADDFVLTARCEHLLWGETSLDPVIERLQAFDAAGADVLYAPGLHSLEAMGQVCAAVTKPVNTVIEMPGKPFSLAEIAETGVKRISIGAVFARLAYGSLVQAAQELQTSGTFGFVEEAFDYDTLEAYFRS